MSHYLFKHRTHRYFPESGNYTHCHYKCQIQVFTYREKTWKQTQGHTASPVSILSKKCQTISRMLYQKAGMAWPLNTQGQHLEAHIGEVWQSIVASVLMTPKNKTNTIFTSVICLSSWEKQHSCLLPALQLDYVLTSVLKPPTNLCLDPPRVHTCVSSFLSWFLYKVQGSGDGSFSVYG